MQNRIQRFVALMGMGALAVAGLGTEVLAQVNKTAAGKDVRIVGCDEPVPSRKRGICANKLETDDFRALAPGVTWYYNWHFEPNGIAPDGVNIRFVPMAWGDRARDYEGLDRYLASRQGKNQATHVLALNEPNLKGQAFISPERTAESYKKIKAIADKYNVPVVGPHMALGSANNDSISADDPIENKKVTYTFMTPFLKAFFHYMGKTEVSGLGIHTYGNIHEMRWAVGEMYKQFNKPVWVTEYAEWNAKDPRAFLIQSTDFLERNPNVEGYAWFKERSKDNPRIRLLEEGKPGKLTALGEAYVNMPVHDADLYYRLPGKLESEKYVTIGKLDIAGTTDTDGFLQMTAAENNAPIEYNVHAAKAGTFNLTIRTGGKAGKIEIQKGDKTLATVSSTEDGWQSVETQIKLDAGSQTLRFRLEKTGQILNWAEFKTK